jgi:hypothetical protein
MKEEIVFPPQAHIHLAPETPRENRPKSIIYHVRSSQPPKGRFKDALSSSSHTYTVRLIAWNCTCAAFAFSAFSTSSSGAVGGERGECEEEDYGGLSFDGCDGGSVPICKHLLACLLGERIGVLGKYVKEKGVSREEMCGAVAEG